MNIDEFTEQVKKLSIEQKLKLLETAASDYNSPKSQAIINILSKDTSPEVISKILEINNLNINHITNDNIEIKPINNKKEQTINNIEEFSCPRCGSNYKNNVSLKLHLKYCKININKIETIKGNQPSIDSTNNLDDNSFLLNLILYCGIILLLIIITRYLLFYNGIYSKIYESFKFILNLVLIFVWCVFYGSLSKIRNSGHTFFYSNNFILLIFLSFICFHLSQYFFDLSTKFELTFKDNLYYLCEIIVGFSILFHLFDDGTIRVYKNIFSLYHYKEINNNEQLDYFTLAIYFELFVNIITILGIILSLFGYEIFDTNISTSETEFKKLQLKILKK